MRLARPLCRIAMNKAEMQSYREKWARLVAEHIASGDAVEAARYQEGVNNIDLIFARQKGESNLLKWRAGQSAETISMIARKGGQSKRS